MNTTEQFHDSDLHFEHVQWQKEMAFWKDEIRSFKNRLSEIATRYKDKNVLLRLDYFKKEFQVHEKIIFNIETSVQDHEKNLAISDHRHTRSMDRLLLLKHIDYRDKMEQERELYAGLKREFYAFLTDFI